jgi:hypothetical protein
MMHDPRVLKASIHGNCRVLKVVKFFVALDEIGELLLTWCRSPFRNIPHILNDGPGNTVIKVYKMRRIIAP